ncbi:LysR family transcriptional regulator [Guyparkeria sp.]|uniref:LysR family transcriptional regulator n=1 Tax=Guyparkeria sp. TaxID=2035736 RepID=UPI003970AB2A
MDFNEAAVFVKVVQAGGFSAAARQMGLPTSTVSQRVARLEKRLGVTLLQRTTRQVTLTDVGELFYRHATVGLEHLNEAEAAVNATTEAPCGLLRVTAPTDFGDALLATVIRRVRQTHPGIEIDLFLTDRLVDLVGEGLDVAIRAGELKDSSLVAKGVGMACWALFASPDYLQAAPPLEHPDDLAEHECVQFASLGREEWQLSDSTTRLSVPMDGRVIVNDFSVVREMMLAGDGIGLLPTYDCRAEVDSGRLVRVLPDWHARADPIHLVYPWQRFVPPKLRAFVDIVAEELKAWLER